MSITKPEVHLYRGTGAWMPSWTDITGFMTRFRGKESGNYAIADFDITLKNISGGAVGIFTQSTLATYIKPLEYFRVTANDGNTSKVMYGYFGNPDSTYTNEPPATVTFHGKDLRWPLQWRTISVNYNYSSTPVNASDAINHMMIYPDDDATGANSLLAEFYILSAAGTGLNYVVPDSNYEQQHPTLFKALGQMLQTLGYEHRLIVTANNSRVINMFPSGADFQSPNISFIVKGQADNTNNVEQVQHQVDYDEIANIIGVWGQTINKIPNGWDIWTDWNAWNNSAWNESDGGFAILQHNFSCLASFPTRANYDSYGFIGMNTSYGVRVTHVEASVTNITCGVTLTFPSYEQDSILPLDDMNTKNIVFKLAAPQSPTEVWVRLWDDVDNVIENACVIDGGGLPDYKGGAGYLYVENANQFKEYKIILDKNRRLVYYADDSPGDGGLPGYDWVMRYNQNNSFNFNAVTRITFTSHTDNPPDVGGGAYTWGIDIDDLYFDVDFDINPRENPDLLPVAQDAASIAAYGRRFKAIADNRVMSVADALWVQSNELVKNYRPINRIQVKAVNALHAEVGKKVTLDAPPYGVTAAIGTQDWNTLEVTHEWEVGKPWDVTLDLIYPATPSSPYISLTSLRLTSFRPGEQLAGMLEDLRDRVDTRIGGGGGVGGGCGAYVMPNPNWPSSPTFDIVTANELNVSSVNPAGGYATFGGHIFLNATAAERIIAYNLSFVTGTNKYIGFFGRPTDNAVGMYDWWNNRGVWTYTPGENLFSVTPAMNGVVFSGNVSATGNLVIQSRFTANDMIVLGNTSIGGILNISGDLHITGNLSVGAQFAFGGYGSILGNLSVGGYINASQYIYTPMLLVHSNAEIETLVAGYINVNHNAWVTGNFSVTGTTNLGDVIIATNLSIGGFLDVTGNLITHNTFCTPTINTTSITTVFFTTASAHITGHAQINSLYVPTNVSVLGNIGAGGNINLMDILTFDVPSQVDAATAIIRLGGPAYDAGNLNIQNYYNNSYIARFQSNPYGLRLYGGLITSLNSSFAQNIQVQSRVTTQDLMVLGNASMDALFVTDAPTFAGLIVAGNLSVGGILNISNDAIFQGNMSIRGTLNVSNAATIYGNLSVAGNIQVQSRIIAFNASMVGMFAQSAAFDNMNASLSIIGGAVISTNLSVAGDTRTQSSLYTYNLIVMGNISAIYCQQYTNVIIWAGNTSADVNHNFSGYTPRHVSVSWTEDTGGRRWQWDGNQSIVRIMINENLSWDLYGTIGMYR